MFFYVVNVNTGWWLWTKTVKAARIKCYRHYLDGEKKKVFQNGYYHPMMMMMIGWRRLWWWWWVAIYHFQILDEVFLVVLRTYVLSTKKSNIDITTQWCLMRKKWKNWMKASKLSIHWLDKCNGNWIDFFLLPFQIFRYSASEKDSKRPFIFRSLVS